MEWFKEFLEGTALLFLQAGLSIYIKTQAFVYISGRMLEILNKNRARNLFALIMTLLFTAGHMYYIKFDNQTFAFVWEFLDWFSMAILFYVLIGFKLFNRIDNVLDKNIGKD